ncbi:DNA-3-methyladenine glycosylase I [Glaciecola siphonariae]|uniref:DNA-3-methyladenine glycosylase I n=1 Tax=Glaciecola siphonariae TaxID=521012 RepID=A0ABV9LW99_9ALTE
MEKFARIYERAAKRKGGKAALESIIAKPKSRKELAQIDDSRVLAEMTKKIFQSGFVWRVVRQKWPNFEEVFWQFDIDKILMMPDEMMEQKATNPAIIRNLNKVRTIRDNAMMLKDISNEHGSVGKWLADWPEDDTVGLWGYLKTHGARLGGNTGPYSLRAIGKDTYMLSRDIEGYFRAHKIIDGGLGSKRSQLAIQNTFNQWRKESGRSLQEISMTVAYSCGDNSITVE